ncbi:hypothetical protein RI367_003277 [Sorochytrium milnesiophthora]
MSANTTAARDDKIEFTLSGDAQSSVAVHYYGATGNLARHQEGLRLTRPAKLVTSWKVQGKEQLWLSSKAILNGSKPIRGGIPLVFPQFGTVEGSKLPQHGFARCSRWRHTGKTEDTAKKTLTATFGTAMSQPHAGSFPDKSFGATELGPDDVDKSLRDLWPHDFNLVYTITLGVNTLNTKFTVKNPSSNKSIDFTCLLHTYFRIEDVEKLHITGLSGYPYTDKTRSLKTFTQSGDLNVTEETDRIFADVKDGAGDHDIFITDGNVRITVHKTGFKDVVVWNPWVEKAKAMADFDDEGYKNMICVEVGNVAKNVTLQAGGQWEAEALATAKL